ncbi:MAG: hypothetical protein J6B12_00580 [Clostridia bacterium]|nr:hypothetical protein [Clostridia bacterium]
MLQVDNYSATLENMTEVARCSRRNQTGDTLYSLYRNHIEQDGYLICVKNDEMCEKGTLRGSLSCVATLFEKIVNGDVPPYILSEILSDYASENAHNFANI